MRDLSHADVRPGLATFVGLATLTYFWYFEATSSARDEISPLETWLVPAYITVMLAAQACALAVAATIGRRVIGSAMPLILLGAAIFTLNFFSTFLLHVELYVAQDSWVRYAVLAGAFGFAYVAIAEIHDSRAARLVALVGGPLLLAAHFATAFAFSAGEERNPRARGAAELSPGMATDAATIRKVPLARRPNVYLLSFDALTPESIAGRYIGLSSPLAYTEALEANGARLLPNAFADREPTKPSLNGVFALDLDYFDALPESRRFAIFSGRERSPVAEIFRHNGYAIQTVYRNNYFGTRQGPYVDVYAVANSASLCSHIERRIAFLGYCTRQVLAVLARLLPATESANLAVPYVDFVNQRIRFAAGEGRPWLTVAYIYSPGHTEQSYDHGRAEDREGYRAMFAHNQVETGTEITAFLGTIREVDPGAIVLVFGDHGAKTSRGRAFEADPEFYVLDRHGVRMAIWPGGVCAREIDAASGGGFITVAMAVRAIITCLSDGLDPVDKSVSYTLPYGDRESYGRYLYEDGSGAPIAPPRAAR